MNDFPPYEVPIRSLLRAMRPAATRLIILCAALLLCACGEEEKKADAPAPVVREVRGKESALRLSLSAKEIRVSQPLDVTLTAVYPEKGQCDLPEFKDKLGEFTVRSCKVADPILAADGKTVTRALHLRLDPFLPGDYVLPALSVRILNATGQEEKLVTAEEKIAVLPVIPAGEKTPALRDIASVLAIPAERTPWLIGGGLLALAALIALFLLLRRRKGTAALPAPLPPHEEALRALKALLAQDLLARGQYKEYYLGLSGILRRYIEARFGLAAPERTTEEFLDTLRDAPSFAEDHKLLLRDFLKYCDLVKFARHTPGHDEAAQAAQSCRNFVVETIPVPEPERKN